MTEFEFAASPLRARTRRLLIWGAGGHGRVVADLARALGYTIVGYIDRDEARVGDAVEPGGARVVIGERAFVEAVAAGAEYPGHDADVAVAIGDNAVRLACVASLGAHHVPALVHPTAVCSDSATVGAGTVVLPRAVVNAAARVGAAVIVNSGAIVEHDCTVGDGAHLSPGSILTGGVRVGARAWVGAGATVIPLVTVGDDAVVGAGAVVIRDVPPGATVVGNPARVLTPKRRA